jgi:hypothetical protein
MSSNLFSTVSNYSGRQPDNQQGIKQFVTTIRNHAIWVYKKISSGETVITPADNKKNVLIHRDLIVEGAILNPSDIILKQNIEPIPNEISDNILHLNPVEFIYRNDLNNQKHFGFIAQDVEKFYPSLVSNKEAYKTVNYLEIIPILLSKIQTMNDDINILKNDIAELKTRV